ncbi:hypothetical protein P7C70_g5305, partial [Phenoliferia sp. Uapishka_3]
MSSDERFDAFKLEKDSQERESSPPSFGSPGRQDEDVWEDEDSDPEDEDSFYDAFNYKIMDPERTQVGHISVLMFRVNDLPTDESFHEILDDQSQAMGEFSMLFNQTGRFRSKFSTTGNCCWDRGEIDRSGVLTYDDELQVREDLRGSGLGSWSLTELWKAKELERAEFIFLLPQVLVPYDNEARSEMEALRKDRDSMSVLQFLEPGVPTAGELALRARMEVKISRIIRFYHKARLYILLVESNLLTFAVETKMGLVEWGI